MCLKFECIILVILIHFSLKRMSLGMDNNLKPYRDHFLTKSFVDDILGNDLFHTQF